MTQRKPRNADPFDVWGAPPQVVLDQLGRKDHDRLRRYVSSLAKKVYRIAYDCGARSHGEITKAAREKSDGSN